MESWYYTTTHVRKYGENSHQDTTDASVEFPEK